MDRKGSIFFSLNDRACGYRYRTNLRRNVLGSEYLIKRLKCEHLFVGHEGCVNTVAWNDCGDVLLSGSDDCKLNIYKLSSMKPVQSIQSGHQANIFSAKFLPCAADTKIASCSGDGVLYYNDVNNHLSYGKNPFRCHTGTTYEVNTTPGDPHTFMSSGEDGTIRLFDLRSKTKCVCEGCKEDVLIDCKKAVTSFSVNPVQPYYVAVGCENSLLRVYDRRSLSTGDPGTELDKQRGLLYQFRPKALDKRDCRVTSLKYSSDGRNLLASYCSDYVFLLDTNPEPTHHQLQAGREEEKDGPCPNTGNDPPMKRLRLRGDWSDTGPNARPEGEEPVTTEDSFVQRISGYLTRWIEESLRSARRQRRRRPNVTRRITEENREQSDESSDSETVEDESTLPVREDNRDHLRTGTNTDDDITGNSNVPEIANDVIEIGDDVSNNGSDVTDKRSDVAQKVSKSPKMSLRGDTNQTSERTPSIDIVHLQHACTSRDSVEDSESRVQDRTNTQNRTKSKNLSGTSLRKRNSSSDKAATDDDKVRSRSENIESYDPATSRDRLSGSYDNETREGTHSSEIDKDPLVKAQNEASRLHTSSLESKDFYTGTATSDNDMPSTISTRGLSCSNEIGVLASETLESVTGTTELDTLDSCTTDQGSSMLDSRKSQVEIDKSQTLENGKSIIPDGESNILADEAPVRTPDTKGSIPSENETSVLGNSSTLGVSARVTIPLGTNPRQSESLSVDSNTCPSEAAPGNHDHNVGESSETVGDDSRRDAAASTIQNFFRFRMKKDFESTPCDLPVHSEVKQVFKGHRNARTMIKEANFWGDEYVLSGSDCGRIFIWSRKTAEVVMLLEGDRHVVNCVQPHPYMPMLATSGIDYDIKLWSPTALNVCRMENAQEVITRNERMLRESRDTLTVPASFMIRVLSSLHRVRFHGGGENQSSGDSDSDLDED